MTLEELLNAKTDFSHLSGMMKEAAEKVASKTKERLLEVLVITQQEVKHLLDCKVSELRRIREMEKRCLKQLEAMNKASEFFEKTANPLPFYVATGSMSRGYVFCQSVGVDAPLIDDEIWKIK